MCSCSLQCLSLLSFLPAPSDSNRDALVSVIFIFDRRIAIQTAMVMLVVGLTCVLTDPQPLLGGAAVEPSRVIGAIGASAAR